MNWDAIILAAGEGTRMLSKLPKVMHKVAGQPMIVRIIEAMNASGAQNIHVVISKKIEAELTPLKEQYSNLFFHIQHEPKGTADAVNSVKAKLSSNVFISNGDHPLINKKDVSDFVEHALLSGADLCLGVLDLPNPGAFGRVIFKNGNSGFVDEIVEAKHCSKEQYAVTSINSGFYFGNTELLFQFLNSPEGQTAKDPNKKEFYLTDVVKYLNDHGHKVFGYTTTEAMGFGVNDPIALNEANQKAYALINLEHMKKGVRFINSDLTYIEPSVEIESDVLIYPNVYLFGKTKIQSGCTIESGAHIKNSKIGPNTMIKAGSYLEGAETLGDSNIGPYSHLREGSVIHQNVKVGNFAEVKNSILRSGVKAGHQCYLGDADIGEETNIGAGTITCNFAVDGKKYKTVIGKNVFIGSDSQIVPPVTISDGAVVAAGATVTKDVETNSLYVTRSKAIVKKNYR